MRKHDIEPMEYTPAPDSSTYQTGAAKPHKEHRGLIAILMILVTFLGGIASALGLLNIRLLQQLADREPPAEHVAVYTEQTQVPNYAQEMEQQEPSAPAQNCVEFPLADAPARQEPAAVDPAALVAQNQDSLVSIYCDTLQDRPTDALGVIMDSQGYILTNAYPVSDCDRIFVRLSDGRCFRATILGTDEFTDLAVLYIDAQDLTVAQFAKQSAAGDLTVALTLSLEPVQGELCQKTAYSIGGETISLVQTDISNAFGPIFNDNGQIVGFSSPFLNSLSGTAAIPSAIIKEVSEQIIAQGSIHGRPCLGLELEEVLPLHQHFWQLPQGLRIAQTPSDNSQLSGLRQGDILISLNGQPVADRESLCAVLRNLRVGQQVEAVIIRNQQQITVSLTIQVSGE